MTLLPLKCNCGWNHRIKKDSTTPKEAVMMKCNYCPKCMDNMKEDYFEWYINDKGETI